MDDQQIQPTKGGNGRDPKTGHFLPGHNLQSPGGPPLKPITAELLRLGDELVTLKDEATGQTMQMKRTEALARGLWRDALASSNAQVKIHAREYLGRRIDREPEAEHTIIPVSTQIYAPRTITILERLQERTGGHPTTRDVLDELNKVPVVWHLNGEGKPDESEVWDG